MKTVYDRIKNFTREEMRNFIYWVYMMGQADCERGLQDDESGYFGGAILDCDADNIPENVSELLNLLPERK